MTTISTSRPRHCTAIAFRGGPTDPTPPPGDIVLPNGHVIRRRPRPPKLAQPEIRWIALPPTAPSNHLYGLDALRINDPRGFMSGDWHTEGHWCWIALREYPPELARTSHSQEALAALEPLFGTERVLDVRQYFLGTGHPDAARYDAIWASAHERALVEMAWKALHAVGTINGRAYPLRERCRWVRAGEQRDWCLEALDRAGDLLTGPQRRAWRQWTHEWRYAEADEEDYFGQTAEQSAL